jgi:hypothetical protein
MEVGRGLEVMVMVGPWRARAWGKEVGMANLKVVKVMVEEMVSWGWGEGRASLLVEMGMEEATGVPAHQGWVEVRAGLKVGMGMVAGRAVETEPLLEKGWGLEVVMANWREAMVKGLGRGA